jgi:hypothetical protein
VNGEAVAICREVPSGEVVLDALLEAGGHLRVRHDGARGLVELLDDAARVVLQVDGPRLVQVPGEAARLLGMRVAVPEPGWWVEMHGDAGAAARVAARLASGTGGVAWRST